MKSCFYVEIERERVVVEINQNAFCDATYR